MSDVTRQSIFEQASARLRQEFDELSSVPHNALKGMEAERLVRRFLNEHLPKRFAVGAGFIIDPTDKVSRQTDVIVYDALNCPVYRASDDAGIYPRDNTAAVVEVKSSLTTAELEDAADKIALVKGMARRGIPGPATPEMAQTLGCVFAFNSPLKDETVLEKYTDVVRTHRINRHVDLILILDRSVIHLACKPRGFEDWSSVFFEGIGGPAAEGTHLAGALHKSGIHSLDYFLRILLGYLGLFRHILDHPGFDWSRSQSGRETLLQYVCSITLETEPERAKSNLSRYRDEVRAEFSTGR